MAVFSLAQRTTGVTNSTPAQEIIAGANNAYRIIEYGLSLAAATASAYALGNPAAAGVTPTSPVAGLAEDSGDTTAAATTSALAWGTAPTTPTAFFRRMSFPASIGAAVIWTFPKGLKRLKTTTLVLWNILTTGSGSAADCWWVAEE